MDYDFSGYATRNDLRCADGRVIRHDAFKDNDGGIVPLVWQHVHDNPTNVLGHALLENRDDGVYAYGVFNKTPAGQHAKEAVRNGDVVSMSIYANRLKQYGSDVIHGIIREVSLVLAGANPGAYIENVSFAHADGTYTDAEDEVIIYSGLDSVEYVSHADNDDEEDSVANSGNVLDELTDEQIDAIDRIIDAALDDAVDDLDDDPVLDELSDDQIEAVGKLIEVAIQDALEHADMDDDEYYDDDYDDDEYDDIQHADDDETVEDVFNSLTDKQKDVVYFLIGQAIEENDIEHSDDFYGGNAMKHNVFDDEYMDEYDDMDVLTHDEFTAIMEDAANSNSLKDTFLAHGITDIDILFPEARMVQPTPDMITRNMGWVDILWNSVKRTPFARIKSVAANLTADEARAKGYVKGTLKVEQVISLLSRETNPQTIYKKQKLDRDDVIDITDIDVIAWLKQELRIMLNEEICRAILVGDGRVNPNANDKIKTDRIRPIYGDDPVYTIYYEVTYEQSDNDSTKASKLVDAAVRARKDYRGTGNPKMFATNEVIADMLLAKDGIGRRLYKDMSELQSALRVSEIVEVPVMENITRVATIRTVDPDTGTETSTTKNMTLKALIVNPIDYTIGSDKGGAVSLFDDFDIDYNQMKYLIETRCSGALTHPYSAIALEVETA